MKLLLLVLLTPVLAAVPRGMDLTLEYTYERYLADFKKEGSVEGRKLFTDRIKQIIVHNANKDKTYTQGVNAPPFIMDTPNPCYGHKHARCERLDGSALAADGASHRKAQSEELC